DPTDENLRQKIEEVRVDVPGLLSRALIASASGNYPQALGLFDEILEVEPSNVNALIGKAVAYRRRRNLQEALNCLDLVLGVQPGNASALLNRGNILLELIEVKGVGRARAKALIDAGFKDPEDFAKATPKSLMAVKGVTRKVAEELLEHFRETMAQVR